MSWLIVLLLSASYCSKEKLDSTKNRNDYAATTSNMKTEHEDHAYVRIGIRVCAYDHTRMCVYSYAYVRIIRVCTVNVYLSGTVVVPVAAGIVNGYDNNNNNENENENENDNDNDNNTITLFKCRM